MGYSIYLSRGSSKSKIKKASFKDLPSGSNIIIPQDPDQLLSENDLNIDLTYNHSWYYYSTIDNEKGIRFIYGMKASDAIPLLKIAIKKLEFMEQEETRTGKVMSQTWGKDGKYDPKSKDHYWGVNARNAILALQKLIALAELAPDFTFHGD